MAGKKGKKNYGNPGTISYWIIKKNLSKDEAILKMKEYRESIKQNKIKQFGSEEAYKQHKSNRCALKRENIIRDRFHGDEKAYFKWKSEHGKKYLLGNRLTDVSYWIRKGFSKKEAIEKIKKHNSSCSWMQKQFWINKGFSEEETTILISDKQNLTSLSSFINRHGEKEGTIRYKKFSDIQKKVSSRKNSKIQHNNAMKSRHNSISYWLDKGFSEEESKLFRLEFLKKVCRFFKEYWIEKGFSEKEAKEIISKLQKKNLENKILYPRSAIEDNVFNYILTFDIGAIPNGCIILNENNNIRRVFPDIIGKNYIIEVFGDYWHANPKRYTESSIMYSGLRAKDIWEKDKIRISLIENQVEKKVYIVWEKDLIEKGLEQILNPILKEMGII